jgi:hypothetical protein
MDADDNGWAMGIALVPPWIGVMFLISTLISLIAVRWTGHPKLVFILLNLVPGLWWTLGQINGVFHGRYWDWPGFETACLLIGLGWGVALYALTERRTVYVEG